jgi:hypothetical protein
MENPEGSNWDYFSQQNTIIYYLIAVAVIGLLLYRFQDCSSSTSAVVDSPNISTSTEMSSTNESNIWFWMVVLVIFALVAAAMYTKGDEDQYNEEAYYQRLYRAPRRWYQKRHDYLPSKGIYDYATSRAKVGYDYATSQAKVGYDYTKSQAKAGYDYTKDKIRAGYQYFRPSAES